MNIVQNQDGGLTKFEYTVILTTLIGLLITISITFLMGIDSIFVIFMFSLVVVVLNIVYWVIVRDKWKWLFED